MVAPLHPPHPPRESNLLGYTLARARRLEFGTLGFGIYQHRGSATLLVVLALALGGAGFALIAPKFSGDNRRADQSAAATAQLNTATDATIAAEQARSATAAASVVKIGEANAIAPESPARTFVAQEIPVALANLPAPDPAALLAAEKRKVAVLEGRLTEASALYATALTQAEQLQARAREAETALATARAERAAVDQRLAEVAAARAAAARQRNLALLAAGIVAALWLWAKITHFSPLQIASTVRDIRDGVEPITALDTPANRLQQKLVNLLSKL